MKKGAVLVIYIFLVSFITVSFFKVYNDVFASEKPKFSYELVEDEGEKEGVLHFKYITHNVGDKGYNIKFLSDVEVDWSIMLEDDGDLNNNQTNESIKNEDNSQSIEKEVVGRTLFLESGKKLENDIYISIDKLQKGKYELRAKLATENVEAPPLTLTFEVN